ncbi:hypothetical protein LB467_14845 [Salegentibacter sp. JZCK2]|uniref:hypothetical protein n=1 Tax=Salegentibacter tibetensis TaxID=2873600 RepID=UPI001CCF10E9|nr:hypothetical protein [Salegentibacter tibetensis]MBZ9730970.1 hypothetical protein [Salegentibacter tibetensis]
MKMEHLEERINEYKSSIKTVVNKRITWENKTKELIITTLKKAESAYSVGWKVQELKWIHTNEAVNITFDSFPADLIDFTNKIPTYQFLQGGALVFSQLHNGDVEVFVTFPILENWILPENEIVELGVYSPGDITEKLIVEKIDEFLKEMIKWEVPILKNKLGFKTQ